MKREPGPHHRFEKNIKADYSEHYGSHNAEADAAMQRELDRHHPDKKPPLPRRRMPRRVILTPLQRLILQSAMDVPGGVIEINRGVSERVYRFLAAKHGCLERVNWILFRITERGRQAAVDGGYYETTE
jgi:hypothetical protein